MVELFKELRHIKPQALHFYRLYRSFLLKLPPPALPRLCYIADYNYRASKAHAAKTPKYHLVDNHLSFKRTTYDIWQWVQKRQKTLLVKGKIDQKLPFEHHRLMSLAKISYAFSQVYWPGDQNVHRHQRISHEGAHCVQKACDLQSWRMRTTWGHCHLQGCKKVSANYWYTPQSPIGFSKI